MLGGKSHSGRLNIAVDLLKLMFFCRKVKKYTHPSWG